MQAHSSSRPQLGWLKLIRVKEEKLVACVGSERAVTVALHWGRKGSVPCVGSDCPACNFRRARWFIFVGMKMVEPMKGRRVILELPESNVDRVEARLKMLAKRADKELWTFTRKHRRSQVVIAAGGSVELPEEEQIEEWEVWRTLAGIWSLPELPDEETNLELWAGRMAAVNRVRLQALATQIDRDLDAVPQ
ncbi:MAG: hypothetical protein ACE5LB_13000 [Acidiferrobacterales bacterium]